ncbi:tripartite tricarboxylate transporter substrate binding protein [Aquabacter spiritensis]|uniref:Putative tricarboxylic transport membrane protein n=1 Tax=Aquabacter spiritensis TaxID=933073 RepID=A0A4R3LWX2_9HYPH|nr:putative tricarboxylic transport membrane protein [Aquabacter spiritensis]
MLTVMRARACPFLMAGLTAAALAFGAAGAQAQDLKIMAPAAPGGGWDQTARAMQQALVQSGAAQSVQVFNVPGAGGTIGIAQFVNTSKGDPNVLMASGYVMMGAILTNKSPVGLDKVTPIARLIQETDAIAVPVNSPLKTVQDLAELVRKDPARVTWAGGSAGGPDHIAAALFTQKVGSDPTKLNYIPFSGGGEALAAILGGKVTAGMSGLGELESQVKAGKLRLLAITQAERIPGLDVPTLKEAGIDVALANWRAIMAPPGLTPDQVKSVTAMIEKMAKSQAWADILKQKGWDDAFLAGEPFVAFLKDENASTADILKSVGLIKP